LLLSKPDPKVSNTAIFAPVRIFAVKLAIHCCLKVDVVATLVWEDDITEDCTKSCFDGLHAVYGFVVYLERFKELEVRAIPSWRLVLLLPFLMAFLLLLFRLKKDGLVLSFLITFPLLLIIQY
jgi:hypothetical protein